MAKTKKPNLKAKKLRKRASHAERLLDAAWNLAFDYNHEPSIWELYEKRMLDVIRRVLREVARG